MITKWSELTIEKFLKLKAISETFNSDKEYQYVSILADIPYEQLLDMKIDAVSEMFSSVELFDTKPNLNKIMKFKHKLGNTTYRVAKDMNEITVAQYIDLQQCSKDDVLTLLSIMLIPDGHKYNDGYDMEKAKSEIAKNFLYEDGMAMSAFFLRLYKIYLKHSLRYSERALRKAPKEMRKEKEEALKIIRKMRDTIGSVI